MGTKIRMGVIGLGGIAQAVHIPGILQSPDAELAAICDIDAALLERRRAQYGLDAAHAFDDCFKLLACPDVDAVSICTPNDAHMAIAMEAVRARKPFALEKPVTLGREDAKTLLEAAEQADVANMVCFSYRFKAAARYARDLILGGKLGTIRHVYCQYLQSWAGPRTPRYWRFVKARAGSGALGDLGSHVLDLVRFVTGREYESVLSDLGTFVHSRPSADPAQNGATEPVDVDDYAHVFAALQGGVSAVFEVTRFAYGRDNYQTLEVYGDEGALVYRLEREDTLSLCAGEEYRLGGVFADMPVPDRYRRNQMQCFFDLLLGRGRGPAADLADGCRNQVLLDAVLESAGTGSRVVLPQG